MKLTFVSNYLNHHQIPVSTVLYEKLNQNYHFIQTEPMEADRIQMGWNSDMSEYPFLIEYEKQEAYCKKLILDSDIVIFGGVEDERYISKRLQEKKITIRYSERLYKEGQWKAISPKGLLKKYKDHTKYRKESVYLLCAGGYVASDFHIVKAYPNKMYQWGYFPEFHTYNPEELMQKKSKNKKIEILWAGRMLDWKHGQDAIDTADYLNQKGYEFHMTMIGDGDEKASMIERAKEKKLLSQIDFIGFLKPEQVRLYMEKADIYLFTSDYKEGWGVVLNEAMNSGCSVVANVGIGAVPFLIKPNQNGLIYKNGHLKELFKQTERLVVSKEKRRKMGLAAYETIEKIWNPRNCTENLLNLCYNLQDGKLYDKTEGPCGKAEIISPGKMYRNLMKRNV